MSAPKHTPGPWRLASLAQIPDEGWPVVTIESGSGWVVMSPPLHASDLGSAEADARLITAAPELLAALQLVLGTEQSDHKAVNEFGGYRLDDEARAAAIAAIAKAEGRE